MPSRVVTWLTLSISLVPLAARAEITFVTDPANFHESASILGFEDLGAGTILSTATPDAITVELDGNAEGFPVRSYQSFSGSLATAADAAGLGAKALLVENGASQEMRFDPPVTRVGMYFASNGSLFTNIIAYRDGAQLIATQVSDFANTPVFLGFKEPDGIDRIVFSGDTVDSDPVLIDRLTFQRRPHVLYHFRGAVTDVSDSGNRLDGVAAGDPLSVSAVVSLESEDFNAFPTLAQYSQSGNWPFTISVGGRTYRTTGFEMQVQNDNPGIDGFGFSKNGPAVTTATPAFDASIVDLSPLVLVTDSDTSLFSDTSIPETQPDLGFFETRLVSIFGFSSGFAQEFYVVGTLLDEPPALAVINTNDAGLGSLRQALLDANATPGADTIVFDIPADLCGADGVCHIAVASPLPAITEAVTIDATTQPRFGTAPDNVCATAETPSYMRVSIAGIGNSAFTVAPSSSAPVVVRGFALVSGGDAVQVFGAGAHRIQCNHILVTAPGDALFYPGPPFYGIGVLLDQAAQGAIIGTDGDGVGDLGERNVISGGQFGVYVNDNHDNRVAGNLFCLAADGRTELGGQAGIYIRQLSAENLVGTDWDGVSDKEEGNTIAGCDRGVAIEEGLDNVVAGNQIGLEGVPNDIGVQLSNGQRHVVADNVFIDNGTAIETLLQASLGAGSERNCIDGNDTGFAQDGSEALLFENNWWGDASGPSGVGPGSGDSISVTGSGSVDFTPFETDRCNPVPEPGAAALGAGALLGLVALARRKDRRR
jgi:hypothetical protein